MPRISFSNIYANGRNLNFGAIYKGNSRSRPHKIQDVYFMKGSIPTSIDNYSVPQADILIHWHNFITSQEQEDSLTRGIIVAYQGSSPVNTPTRNQFSITTAVQATQSGLATHMLVKIVNTNVDNSPLWILTDDLQINNSSGQQQSQTVNIEAGRFYSFGSGGRITEFNLGNFDY